MKHDFLTRYLCAALLSAAFVGILSPGCRNDPGRSMVGSDPTDPAALAKHGSGRFDQVNLVADASSFNAGRVDATLLNAWGIAINPNGIIWISANHSGVAEVYDNLGNPKRAPVIIPTPDSAAGGAPSGVVFNSTGAFVIPTTMEVSKFIFSTEDGTIAAWASGGNAHIVADESKAGTVYKGLTIGYDEGHPFLYATNFHGGTVDVFDWQFHRDTTKMFLDPSVPAGFAPFNIGNIGGDLFVTYAKQKGPDNMDDTAGPGNGYVDIFAPDGHLESRFASQGALNSPWGIAEVPDKGFGKLQHEILIGNFGDGRINVFDKHGRFEGQLSDSSGHPITIDGLWGLEFQEEAAMNGDDHGRSHHHDRGMNGHAEGTTLLYFTAGPNSENDGLFGYLTNVR